MPAAGFLQPVRPRTLYALSDPLKRELEYTFKNTRDKHLAKAARGFHMLAAEMSSLESTAEDALSMKADEALVRAKMELRRNRDVAEQYFQESANDLDKALERDAYWADYLRLRDQIRDFLHKEFGCKITREKALWQVKCIDVSNALQIPGISRAETYDLRCSICGEDPMDCPHTPGQVYEGRLALGVVTNLEFHHIAIVDLPEDTRIGFFPRPLTDHDIEEIFSDGKARQILTSGLLRCKDLIHEIRRQNLRGGSFVRHSH